MAWRGVACSGAEWSMVDRIGVEWSVEWSGWRWHVSSLLHWAFLRSFRGLHSGVGGGAAGSNPAWRLDSRRYVSRMRWSSSSTLFLLSLSAPRSTCARYGSSRLALAIATDEYTEPGKAFGLSRAASHVLHASGLGVPRRVQWTESDGTRCDGRDAMRYDAMALGSDRGLNHCKCVQMAQIP